MMTQFAQLYPSGLIRYTQSTFLELVTDTEVHRIDFQGKVSYQLRRGTRGAVSFHHEHPLLSGVQGPSVTLMARATPHYLADAPALLQAIQREIRTQAGEWYDFAPASWAMWWHRLHAHNVVSNLTRSGGIILNGAPPLVAQVVADICTRYSVETYFLPLPEHWPALVSTGPYNLLLIGRNYVIAREFFASTLRGCVRGS